MLIGGDTHQQYRRIPISALAAGLIQVLVAVGMLFLPVFATCYAVDSPCVRQSYVQMGGSPLGYSLILAVILTHIAVIAGVFTKNTALVGRVIWLAVLASFALVILGAWSIGLAFLPGGALLLIAALAYRRQIQE
jgi:hypothetical protein